MRNSERLMPDAPRHCHSTAVLQGARLDDTGLRGRINIYLRRWAGKKYRRLRTYKRFKRWWTGLLERAPGLLAHWQWVPSP
jgi:hypothetical protein